MVDGRVSGVEARLRLLAAEGRDEIQGCYFSRPLREPQMVAMLRGGTFIDLDGLGITDWRHGRRL